MAKLGGLLSVEAMVRKTKTNLTAHRVWKQQLKHVKPFAQQIIGYNVMTAL